jgi:hypothetical protein
MTLTCRILLHFIPIIIKNQIRKIEKEMLINDKVTAKDIFCEKSQSKTGITLSNTTMTYIILAASHPCCYKQNNLKNRRRSVNK